VERVYFGIEIGGTKLQIAAGVGAGVAVGLLDTNFTSYAALAFEFKLVYFFSAVVSGVVLAGLLSWLAVRAGIRRSPCPPSMTTPASSRFVTR